MWILSNLENETSLSVFSMCTKYLFIFMKVILIFIFYSMFYPCMCFVNIFVIFFVPESCNIWIYMSNKCLGKTLCIFSYSFNFFNFVPSCKSTFAPGIMECTVFQSAELQGWYCSGAIALMLEVRVWIQSYVPRSWQFKCQSHGNKFECHGPFRWNHKNGGSMSQVWHA